MKLNGKWFPQIVTVDRDSGNIYSMLYIHKIVVLASEPAGGRSRGDRVALLIY